MELDHILIFLYIENGNGSIKQIKLGLLSFHPYSIRAIMNHFFFNLYNLYYTQWFRRVGLGHSLILLYKKKWLNYCQKCQVDLMWVGLWSDAHDFSYHFYVHIFSTGNILLSFWLFHVNSSKFKFQENNKFSLFYVKNKKI